MKKDYSVKDILNAVDDILKVKSSQESKKKNTNEIPVTEEIKLWSQSLLESEERIYLEKIKKNKI